MLRDEGLVCTGISKKCNLRCQGTGLTSALLVGGARTSKKQISYTVLLLYDVHNSRDLVAARPVCPICNFTQIKL